LPALFAGLAVKIPYNLPRNVPLPELQHGVEPGEAEAWQRLDVLELLG